MQQGNLEHMYTPTNKAKNLMFPRDIHLKLEALPTFYSLNYKFLQMVHTSSCPCKSPIWGHCFSCLWSRMAVPGQNPHFRSRYNDTIYNQGHQSIKNISIVSIFNSLFFFMFQMTILGYKAFQNTRIYCYNSIFKGDGHTNQIVETYCSVAIMYYWNRI